MDVKSVHAGDLVEPTPPLLGWTSEMSMEVGATYRIRLGTHCGIDHLASINGVDWYLASPAVGEPPPSDPEDTELLWGNITLVEDDRIVLDADGYLTAEYAPGPDLEAGCE